MIMQQGEMSRLAGGDGFRRYAALTGRLYQRWEMMDMGIWLNAAIAVVVV